MEVEVVKEVLVEVRLAASRSPMMRTAVCPRPTPTARAIFAGSE